MRLVRKGQELRNGSGIVAQCDLKVIDNQDGTMMIEPFNYPYNVLSYSPSIISMEEIFNGKNLFKNF